MKKIVVLLLISFLVAGCGAPERDGAGGPPVHLDEDGTSAAREDELDESSVHPQEEDELGVSSSAPQPAEPTANPPASYAERLVGSWLSYSAESWYRDRYTFWADGTFAYGVYHYDREDPMRYSAGMWRVQDDTLHLSAHELVVWELADGWEDAVSISGTQGQFRYVSIGEPDRITESYALSTLVGRELYQPPYDAEIAVGEFRFSRDEIGWEDLTALHGGDRFWEGWNGAIALGDEWATWPDWPQEEELERWMDAQSRIPARALSHNASGRYPAVQYAEEDYIRAADYLRRLTLNNNRSWIAEPGTMEWKVVMAMLNTPGYFPGPYDDPYCVSWLQGRYYSAPCFFGLTTFWPILPSHLNETFAYLFGEDLAEAVARIEEPSAFFQNWGSTEIWGYDHSWSGPDYLPVLYHIERTGERLTVHYREVPYVDYAIYEMSESELGTREKLDEALSEAPLQRAVLRELDGRLVLEAFGEPTADYPVDSLVLDEALDVYQIPVRGAAG